MRKFSHQTEMFLKIGKFATTQKRFINGLEFSKKQKIYQIFARITKLKKVRKK